MVKTISWKDFKIKDLKPNLIPNGWDSFVPYGNEGKETKAPLEVFEKDYAKNLFLNADFSRGIEDWTFIRSVGNIKHGQIEIKPTGENAIPFIRQPIDMKKGEVYYTRAKFKLSSIEGFESFRFYNGSSYIYPTYTPSKEMSQVSSVYNIESDYNYVNLYFSFQTIEDVKNKIMTISNDSLIHINLTDHFGRGNEPTQEWCDKNIGHYLNWEDIPEEDKPVRAWDNMYVGITPLGNGLTRIQTWGGNNTLKLLLKVGKTNKEKINDYLFSSYIENGGDAIVVWTGSGGMNHKLIPTGYRGIYSTEKDPNTSNSEWIAQLRVLRKSNNLDFIASDPQIVEGDKHNPALIVTELDNGQEHVQVYGAYPDTKLVYKGDGAIIGEPYVVESEIDNLGAQLQMETSLDSEDKVIDKGINQLSIKGTTNSKDFEIGVKLRDGKI